MSRPVGSLVGGVESTPPTRPSSRSLSEDAPVPRAGCRQQPLLRPAVGWPFRVLPPEAGARGFNPERFSDAPAPTECHPPARFLPEAVQQNQRPRRHGLLTRNRLNSIHPAPKGAVWKGFFLLCPQRGACRATTAQNGAAARGWRPQCRSTA